MLLTLLLALFVAGCQTPWRNAAPADPTAETAADARPTTPPANPAAQNAAPPNAAAQNAAASPPGKTPGASSTAPAAAAGAISAASAAAGAGSLADDRWVQAVATPLGMATSDNMPVAKGLVGRVPVNRIATSSGAADAASQADAAKYRWRHFGLDAWLARGDWHAELVTALGDPQRVVATNAAILLARQGSSDALLVPTLTTAIGDVNLRLPLRFAAIEALSGIPSQAAHAEVLRLADQQTEFLHTTPSAYLPQMHIELLRALEKTPASVAVAEDNARLALGLASTAPEVRRVALEAWLDPTRQELPPVVLELRRDPDPRVRATALDVLATQRPQAAETLLLAALDDTDLTVRIAAIGALGKLGTPAARTALEKLRTHAHEAARVAALKALGSLGGYRAVIASSQDKSFRVRQAVAENLSQAGAEGERPTSEVLELARTLIRDPSLDVQRTMLASLAAWPLADAGDILLLAMAQTGYQTRKDAAAQLASRWPAAASYPVEALGPERLASVAALTAQWQHDFPASGDLPADSAPTSAVPTFTLDELANVRRLVAACGQEQILPAERQAAVDGLVALGPTLPAALETALADRGPLPEVVYTDALPKVSPIYAALAGLASGDVRQRRTGCSQLLAGLAGKPLPPLALERLVALERRESDPVVWQAVLQATAGDARPGAVQLAYLAVGNPSSDVRRRACDYLAAHPDARHVPVLVPMFEDASSTVIVAAVRAVGAVGRLDDPRPLVGLLLTTDHELRLEVAAALVRLKIEEGRAALGRMALDADLQLRLKVAEQMGALGERTFIPTLIQMSSERTDVSRAALASLTKLTGQDFSHDAEGQLVPRDAQAAQWQAWYRRQQFAGAQPAGESADTQVVPASATTPAGAATPIPTTAPPGNPPSAAAPAAGFAPSVMGTAPPGGRPR
ncbi:MAG TPA: HEAT repeat domain-containing protein [Pirellulales bacterium]|nr:HEAT repeat domain-containing protein [Pirellulales bacterium]